MNKSKKLGEALALCGVALSILKELEENERSELKLLFKALGRKTNTLKTE